MKAVALLTKYAQIRDKKQTLENELKDLSQQIQAELIKDKLKSISTADGKFVATRAQRNTRYIEQATAIEYLYKREDLDVDYFMALNEKKYLNLAETELKMTGEMLPGITTDTTEYLVVRESKE